MRRINVKQRRILALGILPLVALVLMGPKGGCKEQKKNLIFSHARHAKNDVTDCEICHASNIDPQIATEEECMQCHEINLDSPGKECLMCHLTDNYGNAAEEVRAGRHGYSDTLFEHKGHVEDAGLKCDDCHRRIMKSSGTRTGKIPQMPDCQSCHRRRDVEARKCETCHETIRKDVEPENHSAAWETLHGMTSSSPSARCDLCHRTSSCEDCHVDQAPRDHTEQYRRRGHGQMARFDRSRCAACHTEDACVACHQSTPPRSHTPGWGEPSNLHCNQCHLPLGATSCGTCHFTLQPGAFHTP